MESNNDIMEEGKNGRVAFKWKDINQDFEAIIKRNCKCNSLRNKYEFMKKDWRLWKFLKFNETGVGWDAATGKLSTSNEWWERKLKEEPKQRSSVSEE
ncbi:Myb/SANT-like domain [Sesbania bispinosa]|nr:Myb/SANT-like domain [Sesbania bispinosa]